MSPPILRDVEATRKLLEIIQDTPSGGRTVTRLARTCKAFNEPAMDVLWNDLASLLPLIGLFPAYIMKKAKRPDLGLTKMPIDADWEHLLPYADRVRKISYNEGARNVPASIFPVFEDHSPRSWILPNLTHLVWKCDTPASLDHGKIFLNPALQSLTLEIGHNLSNLSAFLASLSNRAKLNSFSLSSLDSLPEGFSRVMAHQVSLEKVSIIAPGSLDAKIGKWISELPELKSLKLDLTGQSMGSVEGFFDKIAPGSGWSTPVSEESEDSGVFSEPDLSEIKKTTSFTRSANARRGAFPQLRQLHLTGKVGNVVTFLKQLVGHIHTLELAIEDPPEEHDWQDLCAIICDKLSTSLGSLRILSSAPAKHVELPRSPGKFLEPACRRLPLSHFTSLPVLAEFEIDLPESVVFDNSDIAHLATICPAIEVLKLCPQARWPSNLASPSVTLNGIAPLTSRCKRLHTLELALTAKAGSNEILNTHSVSSGSLYRLYVGHSHLEEPIQVAILLSHLAPHLDNLKWLNERASRSSALSLHTNADGWHKVCEYLPHLQAVRLAEKKMSAVEIVAPPQTSEKSVDATVLLVDTSVQAHVETTEGSVQFSPLLVDQEISAVPGVNEVSIDARPSPPIMVDQEISAAPGVNEASVEARPSVADANVQMVPTLATISEEPTGVTVAAPALESPEPITETVAPKETPAHQTEPAPKVSFPKRAIKASVSFFKLLSCSAKPVEDEKIPTEVKSTKRK